MSFAKVYGSGLNSFQTSLLDKLVNPEITNELKHHIAKVRFNPAAFTWLHNGPIAKIERIIINFAADSGGRFKSGVESVRHDTRISRTSGSGGRSRL